MNYKSLLAKPAVALAALAALAALGSGAGVAALASADTAATGSSSATAQNSMGRMGHAPGVHGTITAISGNTITLTDEMNNTSYTIDASAASVVKIEAPATKGEAPTETTLSVSSLSVGDKIGVEGTVSGTSVSATKIMTGMGGFMGHGGPGMGRGRGTSGTVTAVSGNTITITGDNGTTYTVDASSAKVSKVVEESVSDIQVGDRIGAQGQLSGTTVTANHVMVGIPTLPSSSQVSQ